MGSSSWLQQFSISEGLLLGVDDTAQRHEGDRNSAGKQTKLKADESRGRHASLRHFFLFSDPAASIDRPRTPCVATRSHNHALKVRVVAIRRHLDLRTRPSHPADLRRRTATAFLSKRHDASEDSRRSTLLVHTLLRALALLAGLGALVGGV